MENRTTTAWWLLPAARRAAAEGHYGTLVRLARTAMRLTQAEAGQLTGYSAATLSRIETGRQPLTDVVTLRRLAGLLGIPTRLLGLADQTGADYQRQPLNVDSLPEDTPIQDGEDPMRRRDLLTGASGALLLTGAGVRSGEGTVDTLEDVLFGDPAATGQSSNVHALRTAVAATRADYHACQYHQLARRLPSLIRGLTATRVAAADGHQSELSGLLAKAYGLATHLLIKLHEDGMAWSMIDRAAQAARLAADPVIEAQTARLSATVMRRSGHHGGAQQMVIDAARRLDADTGLADAPQAAAYGQLLATAAYAHAVADQRSAAWELLSEAEQAARHVDPDRFSTIDVTLYKISVARVLGDLGAALDHARQIQPQRISSPERRARYWQDTALALYGRGRPDACYRALLTAERDAPQEVRYRPWAQHLTTSLLTSGSRTSLPGLREFATRVGITE